MQQSKHTPGPWTVDASTRSTFMVIAEDGSEDGVLVVDQVRSEANARLIAAAPELLAALEALANEYGPHTGRMAVAAPRRALWFQARAAITKALES